MAKSWYSIKNKTNDVLDISIHDEIGLWGVSASEFMAELNAHKAARAINLSVHSPGGNVLEGLAMYNALNAHSAHISGRVEGIAASAASWVLMASDHIAMPEDSYLMIHNVNGFAMGESEDLRQVADTFDKLQNSIVNIYVKRTGKDEADIRDMMKEATWMNADEALQHGFIDSVTDSIGVANKISGFNRYFKKLPVTAKNEVDAINTITDFERHLRDAGGFTRSQTTALVSRAKSIFQRDADDDESLEQLTAALNRLNTKLS